MGEGAKRGYEMSVAGIAIVNLCLALHGKFELLWHISHERAEDHFGARTVAGVSVGRLGMGESIVWSAQVPGFRIPSKLLGWCDASGGARERTARVLNRADAPAVADERQPACLSSTCGKS